MMMMPAPSLSEMVANLRPGPPRALEDDLAVIAAMRIDSGQHLHQGRFAGTVLAHHRVDFGRHDCEIHIRQRFHARKSLGDSAHFKNGLRQTHASSLDRYPVGPELD